MKSCGSFRYILKGNEKVHVEAGKNSTLVICSKRERLTTQRTIKLIFKMGKQKTTDREPHFHYQQFSEKLKMRCFIPV